MIMKKLIGFIALVVFASCNNSETSNAATENPTAIEDSAAQHPNGVTSDRVISTDTSKFDVKPINQDSMRDERTDN